MTVLIELNKIITIKHINNMKKVNKITALIMLVLMSAVVVLSINLVNCHTANKQLRKTVVYQANTIDSLSNIHYTNNMYVGLVK